MTKSAEVVSVVMTAYNHKDTIMRALDSVLSQETDFYFKVYIVDDGSQDGTGILLHERFPSFNWYNVQRRDDGGWRSRGVEVFLRFHQGLMKTYEFALSQCGGKYIAFCDGDDYWMDNHKLQMQYDYMEGHPDCGLCSTRVWQRLELGGGCHQFADVGINKCSDEINALLTFDHLLRGNSYLNAQSYFIRRAVYDEWIDFGKFRRLGFYVWDYPIVLELLKRTKFHHMDFYSAVFTIHQSYTHTTSRSKRLRMVVGQWWIRTYYIFRFGCRVSTFFYHWYRLARDIYSVIFKRWFK